MINDPYSNTPTPNPARRTQSGGYGQLHPAVTQRFRSRMMNYGRPQNSPGGGITPPGPKQQWDPENPGPKRYPPGFDPIGPSGGLGGPQGPVGNAPGGPWGGNPDSYGPADRPDAIMPGPPNSYGPTDGPVGGARPTGPDAYGMPQQRQPGGNYGPQVGDGAAPWNNPPPMGDQPGGAGGPMPLPGQPQLMQITPGMFPFQRQQDVIMPGPPNSYGPMDSAGGPDAALRRRQNEDRFGEGSRPLISGPSGWQW